MQSVMISMYFSRSQSRRSSGLLLLSPLFPFTSRIPPFLNCSSRQIQLQHNAAQDCIALFECKKLALPAAARAAPAPARTRARPKTEAPRARAGGPAARLSVYPRQYRKLLSPRMKPRRRVRGPKLYAIFARRPK